MKIREATSSDIDGIAYVHAESWKTTYKGLISDEFLDKITVEARRKLWIRNFETPNKDEVMYVAENEAGTIIGFANGGARREPDLYDAELYALYLLKEYQGKGLGKLLIRSVAQNLMEKKYSSFMTWVLVGNPAIDFYHKVGGESVASKKVKIGNEIVEEMMIGWGDITAVGR
ncbi:GNAT family N-acetyltransferase [Paenibacillus sp. FSL K6-0276]|uniref:GNAT family N-acetyltransferase n=1 Tax=Paenibacillus sp. FSL K6-0276 TaxID=2921450 RepID=UPI0030EDD85F